MHIRVWLVDIRALLVEIRILLVDTSGTLLAAVLSDKQCTRLLKCPQGDLCAALQCSR